MKKIFAERLNELIELEGIKQKELIEILGVSKSSFILWKEGRNFPRYDYLIKIAAFFNVTLGYLIGESPFKSINIDVARVLNNLPTIFIKRITDYKEKEKLSYYALAQKVGMDQTSVTGWFKGNVPEIESLKKLANAIGETVDFLLGIEE